MRFWDSSAVVPILVAEPNSRRMASLLRRDRECWVWWTTRTECLSALYRRERGGELKPKQLDAARERLRLFDRAAATIVPSEAVRSRAERLLAAHVLRADDAMQLAAALVAAEENAANLPIVTLDDRLAEAARREGFSVLTGK